MRAFSPVDKVREAKAAERLKAKNEREEYLRLFSNGMNTKSSLMNLITGSGTRWNKAIVYFIISKLNTLYEKLPKQIENEECVQLRHFTIIDEAHYMLDFDNHPLRNLIAIGRNVNIFRLNSEFRILTPEFSLRCFLISCFQIHDSIYCGLFF